MSTRYGKIYSLSKEEFKDIANKSSTLKEMLDYIGLGYRGHSYDTLKQRLVEEKIDFNSSYVKNNRYKNMSEILVENSKYISTSNLKQKILKEGLLKNICAICGQKPIHNNLPLALQLDHINGIHSDHRLENLRILCPNCHTQTNTYSGKNKKVDIDYSKSVVEINGNRIDVNSFTENVKNKLAKELLSEYNITIKNLIDICKTLNLKIKYKTRIKKLNISKELLSELITIHSNEKIGKMYGVSGKTIAKRCIIFGIDSPNIRGNWNKKNVALAERSKASDCKSDGINFPIAGSNPVCDLIECSH